jgi:hypothetical protein
MTHTACCVLRDARAWCSGSLIRCVKWRHSAHPPPRTSGFPLLRLTLHTSYPTSFAQLQYRSLTSRHSAQRSTPTSSPLPKRPPLDPDTFHTPCPPRPSPAFPSSCWFSLLPTRPPRPLHPGGHRRSRSWSGLWAGGRGKRMGGEEGAMRGARSGRGGRGGIECTRC